MTALWVTPDELGSYANTEFAQEACETASYLLWAMSGRKFSGVTTVTERYTCVLRRGRLGESTKTTDAVLFGGTVYNIPKTDFDFDEYSALTVDGISPESRIKLRGGPVTKIHSVRNRLGDVIDPSLYYLVDHSTIQVSAGAPWTPCNTEITYSYGAPPPTSGKMAARTLAMEFAKLWSGDDDCALPQRVTSISRQGVSYTILDQQDFIQELRTGLYAIDLFLKTVNPNAAKNKAKVFSVDAPRGRRYTPKEAVLTASLTRDVTVNISGSTTLTLDLTDVAGEFFIDETGWTPSIVLNSFSGLRKVTLPASAITIDNVGYTMDIVFDYKNTLAALGTTDPGYWELFGIKNADTVLVTNGNLKITTTT